MSLKSKKREVVEFLDELHNLLNKDEFNINSDLVLIKKRKQEEDLEFSTPYTLFDLDYNNYDVVERLKELRVEEYSETKIDKNDLNPLLLFVFGKEINGKLVYIKLKNQKFTEASYMCIVSLC